MASSMPRCAKACMGSHNSQRSSHQGPRTLGICTCANHRWALDARDMSHQLHVSRRQFWYKISR
eukprot:scaffold18508_cov37-Attheya_sp.AAC.3